MMAPASSRIFLCAEYKHRVLVGVCAYNEDKVALQRTLMSLHSQAQELAQDGVDLMVIVIQDGWRMAHATTKAYLSEMYAGQDITEPELSTKLNSCLDGQVTTLVMQRVDSESGSCSARITLIEGATIISVDTGI